MIRNVLAQKLYNAKKAGKGRKPEGMDVLIEPISQELESAQIYQKMKRHELLKQRLVQDEDLLNKELNERGLQLWQP